MTVALVTALDVARVLVVVTVAASAITLAIGVVRWLRLDERVAEPLLCSAEARAVERPARVVADAELPTFDWPER